MQLFWWTNIAICGASSIEKETLIIQVSTATHHFWKYFDSSLEMKYVLRLSMFRLMFFIFGFYIYWLTNLLFWNCVKYKRLIGMTWLQWLTGLISSQVFKSLNWNVYEFHNRSLVAFYSRLNCWRVSSSTGRKVSTIDHLCSLDVYESTFIQLIKVNK